MASYNRVILMGNVVRNPELRHTAGSNLPVARVAFAVNSRFKDREETLFIDIVAFGKSAETLSAYVTKGTPLLVEGRLSQRSWEDPNGSKRYKYEVILDTFQFLRGSKERSDENAQSDDMYNSGTSAADSNSGKFNSPSDQMEDDDIPF